MFICTTKENNKHFINTAEIPKKTMIYKVQGNLILAVLPTAVVALLRTTK